jgi:cell division protein ZapA
MDEKLKIKISIADRVTPTVELIRKKVLEALLKKIDVMMKQFEENYAVRDKQDVLAMCACNLHLNQNKNKLTMQ